MRNGLTALITSEPGRFCLLLEFWSIGHSTYALTSWASVLPLWDNVSTERKNILLNTHISSWIYLVSSWERQLILFRENRKLSYMIARWLQRLEQESYFVTEPGGRGGISFCFYSDRDSFNPHESGYSLLCYQGDRDISGSKTHVHI